MEQAIDKNPQGRDRRRRHGGLARCDRTGAPVPRACWTSPWSSRSRSARSASASRRCRRSGRSIVSCRSTSRSSCARWPARFKLSISFENWRRPATATSIRSATPGNRHLACGFHHFWLDSLRRGMQSELGDYCLETVASGRSFALLQGRRSFASGPCGGQGPAAPIARGQLLLSPRRGAVRRISCAARPRGHGSSASEGKIREVRQNGESGLRRGAGAGGWAGHRRRPVHRLHRLSRPADRADAARPATRTGTTGCLATARSRCRPNRSARPCPTRGRLRTRPAGVGTSRCSTGSGSGLVYLQPHMSDDEAAPSCCAMSAAPASGIPGWCRSAPAAD